MEGKKRVRAGRRMLAALAALFCAVMVLTGRNGFLAMAQASDGVAEASVSTAVPVNPAATITTQPKNVSAAVGTTAKFTVAATGSGTLTYQWQLLAPNATARKSSTAASAKTATFSLTVQAGHNGYQVRCIVKERSGE